MNNYKTALDKIKASDSFKTETVKAGKRASLRSPRSRRVWRS